MLFQSAFQNNSPEVTGNHGRLTDIWRTGLGRRGKLVCSIVALLDSGIAEPPASVTRE